MNHHLKDRLSLRSRTLRQLALWLLAAALLAPLSAFAGVFLSVNIAPPALPIYAQPIIPGPGYIWTPGYWAYGDDGYFWVAGAWELPPYVGALWTPGYWGWNNGLYAFNAGYWGRSIGFYGGIDYGFGYTGHGYAGGYWRGGAFNYNRSVNNIGNTHITNVYNRAVARNGGNSRVSFNGGRGGVNARPSADDLRAAHDPHTAATAAQQQHVQMASRDTAMRASVNHGAPGRMAAAHTSGAFNARGGASTNAHMRTATAHAGNYGARNTAMRSSHYAPARTSFNRGQGQSAQLRGYNAGGRSGMPRSMGQGRAMPARMSAPRQSQGRPQGHSQGAPHRGGDSHHGR